MTSFTLITYIKVLSPNILTVGMKMLTYECEGNISVYDSGV